MSFLFYYYCIQQTYTRLLQIAHRVQSSVQDYQVQMMMKTVASKSNLGLGAVHRLRWQDFGFFWPPTPLNWIFYGINIDKKETFLDPMPTSCCKRSFWTTPLGEFAIFLKSRVQCSRNMFIRVYFGKMVGLTN